MLNKYIIKKLYAHKHRDWNYSIKNKGLKFTCNKCNKEYNCKL